VSGKLLRGGGRYLPVAFTFNAMSQLTINLDDNLLQAAQAYARQHGQELDALVAGLLQAAVQPAVGPTVTASNERLLTSVRELAGSLKAPADFDYKRELEEGLSEKYGI
jgi:plasmid stability protein